MNMSHRSRKYIVVIPFMEKQLRSWDELARCKVAGVCHVARAPYAVWSNHFVRGGATNERSSRSAQHPVFVALHLRAWGRLSSFPHWSESMAVRKALVNNTLA